MHYALPALLTPFAHIRNVDEAYAAAERQKARVDPMYHDKIDALVDR